MTLTKKQEAGLKIAIDRYNNHKKYTVISGYAGSGKTTLVRFIIEALGVDENSVCYASFTGKAAQVLLKKGNKNVKTLHKLLYQSFPKPNGGFVRIPVKYIPYRIIIVDECSMAPKPLVNLLLRYPVHVIFLGDPYQLPPINKDEDNELLLHPHIFLDEIMRQAQESEIIRLTMDIRAGKPIQCVDGREVKVLPKKELSEGMLLWADQILCGTNATRIKLNNTMRGLLGREGAPQSGDKLICLRNYWDYQADNEDPLVNGTIGYIISPNERKVYLPPKFNYSSFDIVETDFRSDSGAIFSSLSMDKKMILTGEKCCDWKTAYKLGNNVDTHHLVPLEFTYGYAITYWKAQGSEWDKVLVIEEDFPYDKETHSRAMYTALTRSQSKLVWIKKE